MKSTLYKELGSSQESRVQLFGQAGLPRGSRVIFPQWRLCRCNYLASLITAVFYIGCNRQQWMHTEACAIVSKPGNRRRLRIPKPASVTCSEKPLHASAAADLLLLIIDLLYFYIFSNTETLASHLLRETVACARCCFTCSMFIDPSYFLHLNDTETLDSHLRETAACVSY